MSQVTEVLGIALKKEKPPEDGGRMVDFDMFAASHRVLKLRAAASYEVIDHPSSM